MVACSGYNVPVRSALQPAAAYYNGRNALLGFLLLRSTRFGRHEPLKIGISMLCRH